MKSGGGHAKGAAFEREVCKALSMWVSGGTRDDVFWRTAMSGGRATLGGRKGSTQLGDVCAIHPLGSRFLSEFVLECKFHKSLGYDALPFGSGALSKFWFEHKALADSEGKRPILFARQNRTESMVCLCKVGFAYLLPRHAMSCAAWIPFQDLILVRLVDFLRLASYRKRRGSLVDFWKSVDRTRDCWNWTGPNIKGRGYVWSNYASRISWQMAYGPIPDELCVLHKCDNPSCVKPEHLFLGTQLENIKDRDSKGRQARGDRHGSVILSEQQVLEVRRLFQSDPKEWTINTLAEKFGAPYNSIWGVVKNKTWRHV